MGWIAQKLDNHDIPFYMQDFNVSCALACIAMVIKATGNGSPTERAIMNVFRNAPRADFKVWGGRPKGSYEPEPSDRAQGSRLVGQMVEKNGKMVDRLGTTPEAVISYLGAYKLRSRLIRASDRDDTLDNATLDKPVIIKGEGSGVGAHFIVCFGPHRNLTASEDDDWDLVISDPDLNGVRRATPLRPRYDSSQFTYDTMVPLSATKRLFTSHFYVQLI